MHGACGVFEEQHEGRWPWSAESVGRREGSKVAAAKGQGASCDVAELNYILAVGGAKTCSKSWQLPVLKKRCLRLEKYLKKPQE